MKKILVVDDESDICEILQFNLQTEGYHVDTASSAEEALALPHLQEYALILLDVMMGGISGFSMAQKLRENALTRHIPIIFISALGDEDNVVRGLGIGADDYIAKPLNIRETRARVSAVLRRAGRATAQPAPQDQTLTFGTLTVSPASKVASIDGTPLPLTKLEFELLSLLLRHPGRVFSREDLLQRCWPRHAIVLERTVDVNITRLRGKIAPYGKHIQTRFGYGYTFQT